MIDDWLQNPASLTQRLIDYTQGAIEFKLIRQGWAEPLKYESDILQLAAHEKTWCREISWDYFGKTWVLARTVIPYNSYQEIETAHPGQLEKPIGKILFADASWQRGEICLFETTTEETGALILPARYSVFKKASNSILVTEIFLPEFLHANT